MSKPWTVLSSTMFLDSLIRPHRLAPHLPPLWTAELWPFALTAVLPRTLACHPRQLTYSPRLGPQLAWWARRQVRLGRAPKGAACLPGSRRHHHHRVSGHHHHHGAPSSSRRNDCWRGLCAEAAEESRHLLHQSAKDQHLRPAEPCVLRQGGSPDLERLRRGWGRLLG